MARPRGRGGRPSKGNRSTLITRPPAELADAVRAEAERLDLSYSDYVANVLAEKHGYATIAVPKAQGDQMKLTA